MSENAHRNECIYLAVYFQQFAKKVVSSSIVMLHSAVIDH